ncbi:MAG: pyridoxamine 5'-phosphate oxidase family protein [Acidobacteria bacterium]|nr:pyridoxamine 5'-phosphate oxidase family protein [Acidobacteriota bacterium]
MSEPLGPGAHTRVRRLASKAAYDDDTVFAIVDAAPYCHVAGVLDGVAMALATLHRREGRTIYLHASRSNALLRAVLDAGVASVSVTLYDGLLLARSGFNSSMAYRSALVVGGVREVTDDQEKARILHGFVDTVLSGRADEVRELSAREVALTLVVAVSIDEASAKVSSGPVEDDPEDLDLAIWAGAVPARVVYDAPVPNTDGAMADGGVDLPASVRRLYEGEVT